MRNARREAEVRNPPTGRPHRAAGFVSALLVLSAGWWLWGLGLRAASVGAAYTDVAYWLEAGGKPFSDPFAVTVDSRSGNVLVTDARNQRVVVMKPDGGFLRELGSEGSGPGKLEKPTGVAVGPDGSIYVADYDQDRIRKFTGSGAFLLEWGRPGTGPGEFDAPNGIAVDAKGRVHVADFGNKVVKVFDDEGNSLHAIGTPGQSEAGKLNYPTDIEIVVGGGILVADAYNHRLQRFSRTGEAEVAWGPQLLRLPPHPEGGAQRLHVPTGVAMSPDGALIHVADSGNHRMVMLDEEGRFVADWKIPDAGPQYGPTMVAVSPDGRRVYATDTAADRVIVLTVDQTRSD